MKVKRLFGLVALGLGVVGLASCSKENTDMNYVTLRNDAECEMVLDDNGKVINCSAVNEEGEDVLEDVDLTNKSVYEATILFTTKSIELGFVDPNNGYSTVYVGVVENESGSNELQVNLESELEKYLMDNNINVNVSSEEIGVYAKSASKWGISEAKMRLIDRAIEENPELEVSALVDLSIQEILDIMNTNMAEINKMDREKREEYRAKVKELKDKYQIELMLKEQIDLLIEKINCATIDEDAKILLRGQLELLKTTFDEARYSEYLLTISATKGEFNLSLKNSK